MRAVVLERHGSPEVLALKDVPEPTPPPGWVGVEVRACALNHLDLWARRGLPGIRYPLPLILGNDIAGVVHEVGTGVDWVKPGEHDFVKYVYLDGSSVPLRPGQTWVEVVPTDYEITYEAE